MEVSVYIATSLDGFIARRDGSIDWLNEAHGLVPEREDCGVAEFIEAGVSARTRKSQVRKRVIEE